MEIDKISLKSYQFHQTGKAKSNSIKSKEMEKTSLPDRPKPPAEKQLSWEKAGEIGKNIHSSYLEGKEGILEQLGGKLKKEDIENPKIDKSALKSLFDVPQEKKKEDIMKQLEGNEKALSVYNKAFP